MIVEENDIQRLRERVERLERENASRRLLQEMPVVDARPRPLRIVLDAKAIA
jgi:hypothetical protein